MINQPFSRKTGIVMQEFENEILIYDLSVNKAFCLNQTSSLVFQLCDGTRTVAEICKEMSIVMKKMVSEDLVWLALNGLKKVNLLDDSDKSNNYLGDLNRRKVIKRVGLASMIMLPMISSVVVPLAIDAQSENCQGQLCSANPPFSQGNCCGNLRCVGGSCEFCIVPGDLYSSCDLADQTLCPNACNTDPLRNRCCFPGTPTVEMREPRFSACLC